MANDSLHDHHAEVRQDAIGRLTEVLHQAELLGFNFEELLSEARKDYRQLRRDEIERDESAEFDREYEP